MIWVEGGTEQNVDRLEEAANQESSGDQASCCSNKDASGASHANTRTVSIEQSRKCPGIAKMILE